ncbi:uncharacterized protein LOC125433822 [Sphaerodactylus townsendi]|uniref:uncharacterized protein LOC125433822 n=1 Tax=Sphaerodactylus townsendi TaxID=933632 RepID=UPI00202611D7|nr:uncharacterized protein LOC125433822 [Sphaerodactylus townsendi]
MKEISSSTCAAVFTLGILASLLALCTRCRRKKRKRALAQDWVRLVDAFRLRPPELSESAAEPQQPNGVNSTGENQRLAIITLPLSLRDDDGTASVSSFLILPQRQLPHIPSEDLSATEEMYSNLSFPSPTQEVLYESVMLTGGERDPPGFIKAEEGVPRGREGQANGAEYACVLKVKKKEELPEAEAEAEGPQAKSPQKSHLAKTALNLPMAQVEEMYSVVCKGGKKKMSGSEADGEEKPCHVEMSHGDSPWAPVPQEPDAKAEPRGSSSHSFVPEPCYDSVSESWALSDRRAEAEPAYETIDTHWKQSRRKRKAKPKGAAENLYESIENLTTRFEIKICSPSLKRDS